MRKWTMLTLAACTLGLSLCCGGCAAKQKEAPPEASRPATNDAPPVARNTNKGADNEAPKGN